MKLHIHSRPFQPYKIQVDTMEEHKFLIGFFEAQGSVKKEACRDYNFNIDCQFYDLIEGIGDTDE